jgi:hypothetical protein
MRPYSKTNCLKPIPSAWPRASHQSPSDPRALPQPVRPRKIRFALAFLPLRVNGNRASTSQSRFELARITMHDMANLAQYHQGKYGGRIHCLHLLGQRFGMVPHPVSKGHRLYENASTCVW